MAGSGPLSPRPVVGVATRITSYSSLLGRGRFLLPERLDAARLQVGDDRRHRDGLIVSALKDVVQRVPGVVEGHDVQVGIEAGRAGGAGQGAGVMPDTDALPLDLFDLAD